MRQTQHIWHDLSGELQLLSRKRWKANPCLRTLRERPSLRAMAFVPFVPLRVLFELHHARRGDRSQGDRQAGEGARVSGDRDDRPQRALWGDGLCRRMRARPESSRSSARCSRSSAKRAARSTGWRCYAQDEAGWNNLCHLVSRAHLDRPLELDPHVTLADLEGHSDGLICADRRRARARWRGCLPRARARPRLTIAQRLEALFPGRLYIEIARRDDAGRGSGRRRADRAGLCPRPAAGRDQPGQLSPSRSSTPRTMRCCALPIRPIIDAADRPRSARAMLGQVRADDGRAVRRPARGDWPTRWWSRSAAPSPRPSASRCCPAWPATRKAKRRC